MPPKSSSAVWPPRRTPRTTARKTIPNSSPSPNPNPKPKTSTKSTTKSPPVAAAADSVEAPKHITTTTPSPPIPSLPSPKELNLNPKSTSGEGVNSSPQTAVTELNLKPKSTSAEDDVSEDPQSLIVSPQKNHRTGDAGINGGICADETLVDKAVTVVAVESKSKSIGVSGVEMVQEVGTTKKTVLKKTVRVVKKVVKKKVPKRVLKEQQIVSSNEVSRNLESSNDGEGPNAIESVSMEVEKNYPIESVSMEVEKINHIESVSMEVEKINPVDTISPENKNLKTNVLVSMDSENSGSNQGVLDSMVVEKLSCDVVVTANAESQKDIEACEGEKDDSVTDNLCEDPVVDSGGNKNDILYEDKNDGDEGGMSTSVADTQLKDQNVIAAANQNDECKTDNAKLGSGEGADGLKENETEYLNSVSGEDREGVKEEVAEDSKVVNSLNAEVGLGDGVLLSGELEALERRRRRKTQIFVGGLDKDTKEEDIRKVFEEVGEVTEVRLVLNGKTGKNKGFAFVRYASAADAKNALTKYHKVEICGRQCGTSPVEGNDTLFLGNINKKWNTEDVVKLLEEIGIEKIDKVTVMADPNKIEFNRGFAFLELETHKDAQNAYNKLQKKDVFGKHLKINVAWAEPLIEPDEEEMLKVKSVYAEYLPSSWDEENVTDYFKKFGEIENVALARNLRSSKRKDFAFINYTTREAALACIEAFSRGQLIDENSKVNVKVSLAKPIPKGKQIKHASNPTSKESPKERRKDSQTFTRPHEPRNKGKATSSNYGDIRGDSRSSTTSELVQLLREQASWRQAEPGLGQGPVDLDRNYPSPGRKRPFSVMGDDTRYSDPRGYPRARFGSSYPSASPSEFPRGVGMTALPHHHQQGAGYTSESFYRVEDYPSYLQRRERAPPYHGSNGVYRRY